MASKKRTPKPKLVWTNQRKHRFVLGDEVQAIADLDPKGLKACLEQHVREALREFDQDRLRGTAVYESVCKWGLGHRRLRMVTNFSRAVTRAELV